MDALQAVDQGSLQVSLWAAQDSEGWIDPDGGLSGTCGILGRVHGPRGARQRREGDGRGSNYLPVEGEGFSLRETCEEPNRRRGTGYTDWMREIVCVCVQ